MKKFLCLAALAVMSMSACTKDPSTILSAEDPEVRTKFVNTSVNAEPGELIVLVGAHAAETLQCTKSSVGFVSNDEQMVRIFKEAEVDSFERLFPDDGENDALAHEVGLDRLYVMKFSKDADLDFIASRIARISSIEAVQFNSHVIRIADPVPVFTNIKPVTASDAVDDTKAITYPFNDPLLKYQWHYTNSGRVGGNISQKGADINLFEAWKYETGDKNLIVAVSDGGVSYNHEDLAANMWNNPKEIPNNGKDDDGDGRVDDCWGWNFVKNSQIVFDDHGSHTAGTISAVNNNGIGCCGVAGGSGKGDGVRIMSIQIFDGNDTASDANVALGIRYAADHGASILQASWGYTSGTFPSEASFRSACGSTYMALQYFMKKANYPSLDGGLVIFSSGNDASSPSGFPGALHDILCVNATSCDGRPAYYTNYGPGTNISCPGGDIYQYYPNSTFESCVLSTCKPDWKEGIDKTGYAFFQGTSMACPHMSGIAALGLSYANRFGKKYSVQEFMGILTSSVNDVNAFCKGTRKGDDGKTMIDVDLAPLKGKMGTGSCDAFKVLMAARGITCLSLVTGETTSIDLQQYLGDGKCGITLKKISMSQADQTALGMTSAPVLSGSKMTLQCNNPGSAVVQITFIAGGTSEGTNSQLGGMAVTKDIAIVSRKAYASNGAWL